MRFITAMAALLSLAAASTSAVAAPTRLDDVQFIAANRCLGLMTSKALASPDADALRKLLRSQAGGRDPYISDKADQARDDAQSEAARGGAERLARLTAERDGVCKSFLADVDTAFAGGGRGPPSAIR